MRAFLKKKSLYIIHLKAGGVVAELGSLFVWHFFVLKKKRIYTHLKAGGVVAELGSLFVWHFLY